MRLPWVRCLYWNLKTDIITAENWSHIFSFAGREICVNLCVLWLLAEKQTPNRARLEVQLGNFGCSCESSGVFSMNFFSERTARADLAYAHSQLLMGKHTKEKSKKSGWRSNTRELISILSAQQSTRSFHLPLLCTSHRFIMCCQTRFVWWMGR